MRSDVKNLAKCKKQSAYWCKCHRGNCSWRHTAPECPYKPDKKKNQGKVIPWEGSAKKSAEQELVDALRNMHFAYINKDANCPHDFEASAVDETEKLLAKYKGKD